MKQALKDGNPTLCGPGCKRYHHRRCTECGRLYSIHDEHFAFSTEDDAFHEGHTDCLQELTKNATRNEAGTTDKENENGKAKIQIKGE